MMDRRDLLLGAGCLIASAGGLALRPRRMVNLMGNIQLTRAIPDGFAAWQEDRGIGVLMPPSKGSLADRLYKQILARAFWQPTRPDQPPVMLLISYGAEQSDALQLHRPETCYPAVGYTVQARRLAQLPLAGGGTLPIVEMSATAGGRTEDVLYWTRVGEDLPQTAGEQRTRRLEAALHGTVGDGVLVRTSMTRTGSEAQFENLRGFVADMLSAITPATRRALIGTTRAAHFPQR